MSVYLDTTKTPKKSSDFQSGLALNTAGQYYIITSGDSERPCFPHSEFAFHWTNIYITADPTPIDLCVLHIWWTTPPNLHHNICFFTYC